MPLFTVALMFTVPVAVLGGDVTVHSVVEAQLTLRPLSEPNLNLVADSPRTKPLPVTVTLVPPTLKPVLGATEVIVGVYLNLSAVTAALVPPAVVTVRSTVPTASAGDAAVTDVAELTWTPVA